LLPLLSLELNLALTLKQIYTILILINVQYKEYLIFICSHVVFGHVVDGMDVVYKMEAVGTNQGHPTERVVIEDCGELKE